MAERAREIKFEHFRGLPSYSCKLSGKSAVILSDNGKGKSCIVDGVEFLFSGTIARFHGEGTGAIDPKEAIQHVQRKGEAAVELYLTPTNDKIKRALSSSELEIPPKPAIEDYVANHPRVESFILRRAQILDFISDQDASRYRKYIQLLGLTDIDTKQRVFVEASQLASEQLAASRRNLTTELVVFRDKNTSADSSQSVLAYCSEMVSKLGLPELTTWDGLDSALTTLEARRSPEVTLGVDALNKAILSFERQMPAGIAEVAMSVTETHGTLMTLRATSEEAAASGIIKEGISFFHRHSGVTVCPLCEKSLDEDYGDVIDRLKKRDQALIELREREARFSKVQHELETKLQQAADRLEHDLENKELLSTEEVGLLTNARESLRESQQGIRQASKDSALELSIPADLDEIAALRRRIITDLTARRTAVIPSNSSQLENAIALLTKAKDASQRIRDAESALRKAEKTNEAADQAKRAFSTARENAIQQIFDQIADKVLTYYRKLHEVANASEQSECTALSLTSTPRAAAGGLRLAIQFLGLVGSSDARAFLSEGHLDSLGLCIYLATVRIFNRPGSLLVLDDVLTSVDKEHRHRVAELLFEDFADYQIILTTHDEFWFANVQSMAQARGEQGNWVFKRISRWTLDAGPESAAFENTWSYVESHLTEESYRELGGPLRLVLEDFLKRVAAKIGLDVRYNFEGKYTSGDFVIAGIQNKIRSHLVGLTPDEEADIKLELGRVFGGNLINFLSHDNPGRLEVTFAQTVDFVSGLKALVKRCKDGKILKGVAA
jgi:hypothetical protein